MGRSPPLLEPGELVAALRRCTLAVAPLLHCASLPPQHISSFEEWSAARRSAAAAFVRRPGPGAARGWLAALAGQGAAGGGGGGGGAAGTERHPVEPLSLLSGSEFVHAPFDVSEVRLELGV